MWEEEVTEHDKKIAYFEAKKNTLERITTKFIESLKIK